MALRRFLGRAVLGLGLLVLLGGADGDDEAQSSTARTPEHNESGDVANAPTNCQLFRVTQADLTTERDGIVTVPASVNGQKIQMLVDTGGSMSLIADTLAIRQQLRGFKSDQPRFVLMGGVKLSAVALVNKFSVGGLPERPAILLVAPWTTMNADISGMLGPDIMSRYEVEIDFAGGKFALYTPEHCPGQVVYWTKEPFARVPFEVDASHHMLIHVVIDGHDVPAAVDTGADRSTMTLTDFEDIFGIRKTDPNLKVAMDHASINGTDETTIYAYPFKTMTFEGINVQAPGIDIVDGDRFAPGGPKMVIGVQTLRQLHMFISYAEHVLYLTAAEAR